MFKLVVLCAFLAVVVAEPEPSGTYFATPLTYSSTVISPAVTTISKSASSVVHPSPSFYYSAPTAYTHFIKKRSAPFIIPTTYAAGSPFVSTYSSPIVASAPVLSSAHVLSTPIAAAPIGYAATAHLIKKRSAPIFAPATYSTYQYHPLTYSSPLISSSPVVSTAPLYSSSVFSHAPIAYSHLIKKRSAQIPITSYIAPSSVTHQSRFDIRTSPYFTSYTSPLTYTSPFAYSHVY